MLSEGKQFLCSDNELSWNYWEVRRERKGKDKEEQGGSLCIQRAVKHTILSGDGKFKEKYGDGIILQKFISSED